MKRGHARVAAWSPREESYSEEGKVSNTCIDISSSVIPELKTSDSHFKIQIVLEGQNRKALVAAMVDCGATALFISKRFVERNRVRTCPLTRGIRLCNIDGSENRAGGVSQYARLRLRVGGRRDWENFLVTDLGPEDVVLGLPWLRRINPEIDWAKGSLKLVTSSKKKIAHIPATEAQCRRWQKAKVFEDPSERLWCAAGYTYSTELAEKASQGKPKRSFEDIVPEQY